MKNMFKVYDNYHEIGNIRCTNGMCDWGLTYPKRCKCGGLIHVDLFDETPEGPKYEYKCDKCGVNYEVSS